jgi:hypothetical protein
MPLDQLQQQAMGVIRPLVPADASVRVSRAVKQWNLMIREHIRNETGLRLAAGEGRSAIPVRVTDGFPERMASLINHYPDPLFWRLVLGLPALQGMTRGLTVLLNGWQDFETWEHLPRFAKRGRRSMERTLRIGKALEGMAAAKNLQKDLRGINEDILGMYSYGGIQNPTVDIFWMPIAMVSAMLGVQIEDLALVTLIHELSHGYTHIGHDIDGRSWDDPAFGKSELAVKEGLAQFYTEVISERIRGRSPGVNEAYDRLLALQGGAYRAHLDWLKGSPQRGEGVRFAIVTARTVGPITHAGWKRLLAGTNARLTRGRKPQKTDADDQEQLDFG